MVNQKIPVENRKVLIFKDLQVNNLVRLGLYNGAISKSKLDMHIHEGILEIIYLDSGYQIYIVGNEEYHLKGGDVFIAFPSESHGSGHYLQGKGVIYWLQINISLNQGDFLSYHNEEAVLFVKNILGISKRHFSVPAEFKKALDNLFEVGQMKNDQLQKVKIYSITSQILLSLLDASTKGIQNNQSDETSQAMLYIKKNIDQDISVEELADHVHLSVSHFKSKFKNEIGTSPADFVQRQKIIKSEKLLLDPALSITDIAYSLSYSSSQHFSTVFKKYTGKSPTEFKQK